MATKKAAADEGSVLDIPMPQVGLLRARIIGTTPLILNRMSQKVWHELLAPKGRKTAADKAANLKHDPIQEFRASPYIIEDESSETLIGILPSSFKKAMGTAALDTPGAKKAQIGRLVYIVSGTYLEVYGIPRVFMSITRSADINKTPDVRTRAIIPEWAAEVSIRYNKQILQQQSIANLLAAAGMYSGVGDWRQEKGSGSYGSFQLVSEDNAADYERIVKQGGRKAQRNALENPIAFNRETEEMLEWFRSEVVVRGFELLPNGEVGRRQTSDAPVGVRKRKSETDEAAPVPPKGRGKGNGAHPTV